MSRFEIPSVLSRVRVASPCNQGWDTMQGNDQVRFCDHCAKHVHDLSEMTPEAALELVAKSEGQLCVRYESNPDGSPRIADPEPLTGGFRWPNLHFAAGVLAAALTMGAGTTNRADAAPSAAVARTEQPTPDADAQEGNVLPPRKLQGRVICIPTTRKWVSHDSQRNELRAAFETDQPDGDFDEFFGREFFEAVEDSELDKVRELLQAGYSPNISNRFGDTPLMIAAEERSAKSAEFVDLLLEAGADPNAANKFGVTPLMYAALRDAATVNALLDADANPNAADDNGRTPLMLAVFEGNLDVVRLLVRAGANTNARDAKGQSVLGYAIAAGGPESDASDTFKRIMKLLKKTGAQE